MKHVMLILCFWLYIFPVKASEIKQDYVLILSSVFSNGTWNQYFNEELQKRFSLIEELDLETYTLSVPSLNSETKVQAMRKKLLEKFATPPKAVIIVGATCWHIVSPLFDTVWKNLPIILCDAKRVIPVTLTDILNKTPLDSLKRLPVDELRKRYNLALLEQKNYISETLQLMKRLQPQMDKVVFISDSLYMSQFTKHKLENVLATEYPDLKLEILNGQRISVEELLDTISTYDDTAGLIYYSWARFKQQDTEQYWADNIGKMLSSFAKTLLFTLDDLQLEEKYYSGGYYISTINYVDACMDMFNKIQSGQRASELPLKNKFLVPKVYLNYLDLQWFGIPVSRYPGDAVYFNKPQTFFQRYSGLIPFVGCVLAVLLAALLYFGYRDRKHRRMKQRIIKSLDVAVYLVNKNGIIEHMQNIPEEYNDPQMPNNVKGRPLKLFIKDEIEHEAVMVLLEEVLKDRQTGGIKCKITRLNGQELYTSARMVYYNKSHVLCFVRNISDVEKERILNERSRFFLESILDNLPIATIVKDMNDDGKYLIWNKKAAEMINVNSSAIVGKRERDFLGEERTDFLEKSEKDVIDSGMPHSYIKTVKNFDGSTCMLSIRKALVTYEKGHERWLVSSSIDITETEAQRRQIEAMNQHYLFVMQAIGLVSWTWDLTKDEIRCNRDFFVPKSGASTGAVTETGEQYYSQLLPECREKVRQAFSALCSGEIQTMTQEYQIVYEGDNEPSWAETFAIVSERDDEGKPTVLVGATRLIDERKQMEKELMDAKERAEEVSRLKSAFLANMSHEIRTPLNAIVGFSGLLAESAQDEESREYIQIIENNNQLLLQLISDILDLAKIESGTLEFAYGCMDVNGCLKEIEAATALRLSMDVCVRFNLVLQECQIYTEKNRLLQVINNYLSNAIKYTTKGVIEFGYYLPENGMIRFYVRDTGCGIPEDKHASVFGRFVKLDSFKQGTGLGLSICSMIAEKMHGKVGVSSEVGKGSEFWFEIPYQPIATFHKKE